MAAGDAVVVMGVVVAVDEAVEEAGAGVGAAVIEECCTRGKLNIHRDAFVVSVRLWRRRDAGRRMRAGRTRSRALYGARRGPRRGRRAAGAALRLLASVACF